MDPLAGKLLFFLGYVIPCFVIRGPHIKVRNETPVAVDSRTRLDNAMLVVTAAGSLAIPSLYCFTPLFDFADYHLPLWVGITGIVMLVLGNWIFWLSHRDLGRQWSPVLEVYEDHRLITDGIYRRVRHPMYSATFVVMAGLATVLPNYVAGFAGLLIFGALYVLRVPKEERIMIEQFGDEYRDYVKRTGRLVPK